MSKQTPPPQFSQQVLQLETQVETLLHLLDKLAEENRRLKQREQQLVAEQSELVHKTDTVRNQIETMLGRLNALENTNTLS
jgi:cell division protein ZapB